MQPQSAAQKNPPPGVTPPVRQTAPWRVTDVQPLPNFRLKVQFADGLNGFVELSARVRSARAGVFAVLADPAEFSKAFVDLGVVTWPGEIDLAPDAMYAEIKKNGEWRLL